PDFKLDIQGVRLFRDDSYILEDLLLEARRLDGERIPAGGKSVEIVNSVVVGRSGQFLVGLQICQRKCHPGNNGPGRIGHDPLNRSPVLRISADGAERENRNKKSLQAHGVTSRSIFVNIGKTNSVNRFTAPLSSMRHPAEQRCQAEYARCSQRVVLEPAHNKSIFLTSGTPRRLRKISPYRLPSQLPLCHTTPTITPCRGRKRLRLLRRAEIPPRCRSARNSWRSISGSPLPRCPSSLIALLPQNQFRIAPRSASG